MRNQFSSRFFILNGKKRESSVVLEIGKIRKRSGQARDGEPSQYRGCFQGPSADNYKKMRGVWQGLDLTHHCTTAARAARALSYSLPSVLPTNAALARAGRWKASLCLHDSTRPMTQDVIVCTKVARTREPQSDHLERRCISIFFFVPSINCSD